MKRCPASALPALLALAFALLFGGCATPYVPAHYVVSPNRPYKIETQRTVVVFPAFDRLDPEVRGTLDQSFNPSSYLTGMLEDELAAAGTRHERAEFATAPSFEGVQKALEGGALHDDRAVVLASAITFFEGDRMLSCDFRLYSSKGVLLFEKRGLCMNMTSVDPRFLDRDRGMNFLNMTRKGPDEKSVAENRLLAPRMVMQQLFADPDFQKALQ